MSLDLLTNKTIIFKDSHITIARICSTIEAFTKYLPFSIDPLSTHFVPADLLNAIPEDRLTHPDFKNEETTLFTNLQKWNDTRRTAYSIQLCYLLQKLLQDKTAQLPKVDDLLVIWGLSKEDSEKMKTALKRLSSDRDNILKARTILEREAALSEAYKSIQNNFCAWGPAMDLDMYFYYSHLNFPQYSMPDISVKYRLAENSQFGSGDSEMKHLI